MSGNAGNFGAANLHKHAKGFLMALALGLMLACGTAYASEPASPAPVTPTHSTPKPASSYVEDLPPNVGDLIFDGSIIFLIIILGALISINFLGAKDKSEE